MIPETGHIPRVSNCNWVDRRQVLHCRWERKSKIREQLEAGSEHARTYLTDITDGRLFGCSKNNQECATTMWTAKQSSNPAELPNSTDAIQRTSSRTTVEVAHVVRFIFFFIGMDRIAIFHKLGGLPMIWIYFSRSCAYRKLRFLCKRRSV